MPPLEDQLSGLRSAVLSISTRPSLAVCTFQEGPAASGLHTHRMPSLWNTTLQPLHKMAHLHLKFNSEFPPHRNCPSTHFAQFWPVLCFPSFQNILIMADMGKYKASAANKGSLNSCQRWPRQVAWLSFYLPGLIVPLWSVCNGSPLYWLGFLYHNKAMRKQTHESKESKAKYILALRIKLTQNKLTSLCFQANTFVYWAIAWAPECVFYCTVVSHHL